MGVSRQEFADVLKEQMESASLQLTEIPNIDLYIDQITNLFDTAYADRKRNEEEKTLTKTMVNNYSKEGILRAIKGKKYSREHIIQMAMIYLMKQTLSIQDIKSVFCSQECENLESFETVYQRYIQISRENEKRVSDFFVSFSDKVNTEDDEQLLASILYLCHISSALERAAETIIDKHMTVLDNGKTKK